MIAERDFSKRGFTMMEIVIAIFVFTIGLGSSFALVQKNILAASLAEDRLIASYLAQEGVEIVRNIRDSNWLKGLDWDEGIQESLSVGWEADYNSMSLSRSYNNESLLNIETETGFYGYSFGIPTKFKREIFISIPDDNENKMIIKVTVRWSERGRSHEFEVIEHLYNWKP